jgi:hypothetical protein
MIVVNIHLKSAISRSRDKELARFVICNTGEPAPPGEGHYYAESYRGRSTAQLDRRKPSRSGQVRHHKRDAEHVLNLVAKALKAMGYGQPPGSAARGARGGIDVKAGPQ